jgi:hypothetical protein
MSLATLGQNQQWVAFWAHFGVAALIVENLSFGHPLALTGVILAAAAVKEFWYDATYEKNPQQTFADNLEDWLGWSLGAVSGIFLLCTRLG